MTLSFSTKWPKHMGAKAGEPNYFVEKILASYKYAFDSPDRKTYPFSPSIYESCAPKIHTIRKGNRWKRGMGIHAVINNRTSKRYQFAPFFNCVSVQEIEIIDVSDIHASNVDHTVYVLLTNNKSHDKVLCLAYQIKIDGNFLNRYDMEELAINDGFDSLYDFFCYFNTDFKGQIIHWTDLRY